MKAWRSTIALFILLLVVDWVLYFRHAGHFFQPDSVFLLDHRAHSISDFFKDFIQLHPSGWYRPLAFETLPTLLFPILKLEPVGYRIPLYLLFLVLTIEVYMLAWALSRSRLVAGLATFFFNIHTVNAYTTFDIGFMPELQFTFFYIGGVLAYLDFIRRRAKWSYGLSLICFAGSLLSKEAAVTLPGTLFVLHLLYSNAEESFGRRIVGGIRSVLPHAAVLMAYLLFVAGYLHVQGVDLTKVFERPENIDQGGYYYVVDSSILDNLRDAGGWAFNLPSGWFERWNEFPGKRTGPLFLFALLTIASMATLLHRPERKLAVVGLAWFGITILPALPLVKHFLPYYVFLPVVGFSIFVACCFGRFYDVVRSGHPQLAAAAIIIVFAGELYACNITIKETIRDADLLGGSAKRALNSLTDLKSVHPTLPANATLYIDDSPTRLAGIHNNGGLIRMAYDDEQLAVVYRSDGTDPYDYATAEKPFFYFREDNQRLVDKTDDYRRNPANYNDWTESEEHKLQVNRTEVTAGDKYSLSISGCEGALVTIAYTINGEGFQTFQVRLNQTGKVDFDVSASTKKGVYEMHGFRIDGQPSWFSSNASVRVR